MGQQNEQLYCDECRRLTLHTRVTTEFNHVLHLLVCLFCCGLWLPLWLLSSLANDARNSREPFRCQFCGCAWTVPPAELEAAAEERARRWRKRKQAIGAGAEAMLAAIAWLGNRAVSVWLRYLPRLKRAPAALAAAPAAADSAMRRVVGEENTILIAFVRCLIIGALATMLTALAMTAIELLSA